MSKVFARTESVLFWALTFLLMLFAIAATAWAGPLAAPFVVPPALVLGHARGRDRQLTTTDT